MNSGEPSIINNQQQFFAGGGEMGALIRSIDWSKTALGPVEKWSQSLRTSLSTCLNSKFPILLWWGIDMVMFYNDAYRPILGSVKHPRAMGQKGKECWPEIWHIVGPMLEGVLYRGEATWSENQMLPLDRNGYVEECYFTFSYSPIHSENGIGGIFTAVYEVTQQVLTQRRLDLLRELAEQSVEARTIQAACQISSNILSKNQHDIPYALIYLFDKNSQKFDLATSIGLEENVDAQPEYIELGKNDSHLWPLIKVIEKNESYVVENANEYFSNLPGTPWPECSNTAVLSPLTKSGENEIIGVLVTGISPRKKLDEEYSKFIGLVAGQITTTIANATAYEEQRKRAEALAEIDKAKTVFFSNISHEFRTPLTLMLGPLEEALNDSNTIPINKERLTITHRNTLRLLKLVNSLLDFSRIEAGRIQAVFKETNICNLTIDLSSAFRSIVENAGLRFNILCSKITDPVYVDTTMWERIIFNLLSNAFKYTFNGEITLSLKQVGSSIELVVKDTGTGIPQEEIPKLFSRFHRVENAQGRTHEGSGIGLAMVYELVKLHGGSIVVESKLNEGTTFTVSIPTGKVHLPALQLVEANSKKAVTLNALPNIEEELGAFNDYSSSGIPSPINSSLISDSIKEKILLADDNADMREYLLRLLGKDYEVRAVADGNLAWQAVKEDKPSLILSDIMMPNLDGIGLLKRLREDENTKTIPVIFISARAGEEAKIEGIEAGADDYLVKPFSAKELLARVQTNLNTSKLRKEAEETIKAERQRLYEVFVQAPAMICILKGNDLVYELANPLYLKALGKTKDIIGKGVLEVFPEIKEQPIYKILTNVYNTGKRFVGNEIQMHLDVNNDGTPETVYFNFVYEAYRDSLDNITGVLVHAVDVTGQVLSRKKIEDAESRSRLAIEAADLGAFDWDLVNQDFISSPRLLEIFGFKDQPNATHQNLIDAFHPDDKHIRDNAVANSTKTGSFVYEARVIWQDKSIHWIRIYGRIIYDEKQQPLKMYGIGIDITEQKNTVEKLKTGEERLRAANEELAASNKELANSNIQLSKTNADLDNFIYTASHDLKAPVSNIEGLVNTLVDVINEKDADAKEIIDLMNKSILRFKGTILDLTEISKTQKDNKEDLEEINVQDFFDDVTSSIGDLIIKSGAILNVDITDCKTIRFSKSNFRSILYNLVSNAIKYKSPHRKPVIEITCKKTETQTLLTIKDNGLGISQQNIGKMFSMFKRFHDHVEGTGIGLYIVKRIIDNAGGRIEVESEVGIGTTFKVYFKNE